MICTKLIIIYVKYIYFNSLIYKLSLLYTFVYMEMSCYIIIVKIYRLLAGVLNNRLLYQRGFSSGNVIGYTYWSHNPTTFFTLFVEILDIEYAGFLPYFK